VIENEKQLRYTLESVARMHPLCDRIAAQAGGDPETRFDEIAGVENMIRKIEREIAAYLNEKCGSDSSAEKPMKMARSPHLRLPLYHSATEAANQTGHARETRALHHGRRIFAARHKTRIL